MRVDEREITSELPSTGPTVGSTLPRSAGPACCTTMSQVQSSFFLGGRPFCINSQRGRFNQQRHCGYVETDDGRGTDQRHDTKRLTQMSENAVPPWGSAA